MNQVYGARSFLHHELALSRRDFLTRAGSGFGLLALFSLLEQEAAAKESTSSPTTSP